MIRWERCEDGDSNERADCTVQSITIACAAPYQQAHELLNQAGRRDKHRFNFRRFMRERTTILGCRVTHVGTGRHTLAQVVRDFPQGTFILRKRGHVFCLRNGVVVDYSAQGPRTIITDMWYVEKTSL